MEAGQPARALPELEGAVEDIEAFGGETLFFYPDAHFHLAQALVQTGGDRQRAVELAKRAANEYAELGPGKADDKAAVEAWLEKHDK